MKEKAKIGKNEMHPLFPSGKWEGFYTYKMGPDASKHKMEFSLLFRKGNVIGSGSDNIGAFTWKGSYDKERFKCTMIKNYKSHKVYYKGDVDENGIWGTWDLDFENGGFHIWPKADQNAKKKEAVKEEASIQVGKIKLNIKQM